MSRHDPYPDLDYELALSNLRFGSTVIIDCFNSVIESRDVWSEIAISSGASLVHFKVNCPEKEVGVPHCRPCLVISLFAIPTLVHRLLQ